MHIGALVPFYATHRPTFLGQSLKGPCNTFQGYQRITVPLDSVAL